MSGDCASGSEPQFSCAACGDTFATRSTLCRHDKRCNAKSSRTESSIAMKTRSKKPETAKDKKWECEICGTTFSRRYVLACHYRTHDGSKPYECGSCGEKFSWSMQLRIHAVKHPGELVFKCTRCEKKFKTVHALQKHAIVHPRSGVSQALKRPVDILNRKPYRRSTASSNCYCVICQKYFHKFSYLQSHWRAVHQGENNFKCGVCGEEFRWAWQIRVHAAKHPSQPVYKCAKCGDLFKTQRELTTHKKSHPKYRYECDICSEKFVLLREVVVHSRRHTRTKCYKCSDCERCFAQPHLLKRHSAGHDPMRRGDGQASFDEPGQRYHCGSCRICFSKSELLAIHLKHHQNPRPHQCEWCGKCFLRADNLRCHLRIHTGEKPYQCEFCKKAFKESGQLVKHRRIHTGEKPFICELCGKGFTDSSKVKKHQRSMHSGNDKGKRLKPSSAVKEFVRKKIAEATEAEKTPEHPSQPEPEPVSASVRKGTGRKAKINVYMCEVCGLTSTDATEVEKHMSIMHSDVAASEKKVKLSKTLNLTSLVDTMNASIRQSESGNPAPMVETQVVQPRSAGSDSLNADPVSGIINDLGHTIPYECGLCYQQFLDSNEIIAHMETHTGGVTSCVFLPNGESGRAYTSEPPHQSQTPSQITADSPSSDVPQFDADIVREFFQQQEEILSTNEPVPECPMDDGATVEVPLEQHLSNLLANIPEASTSIVISSTPQASTSTASSPRNQKIVTTEALAPVLNDDLVIQRTSLMPTAELTREQPATARNPVRVAKMKARQKKKAAASKPGPATVGGVPIGTKPKPAPLYDLFLDIEPETETETGDYECDFCDRKFRSKQMVVQHHNTHTGEKPFGCQYCKEEFSGYLALVTHSLEHEEYDKKCFICHKKFDMPEKLLKHTRYHLSQTKMKCKSCDQTFTNTISLDEHMRSAHASSEPHQCEHCGKFFKLKGNLEAHVRTHTGEKPFGPCEYCGKFFREMGQLKRHTRSHTGDRPFPCPFCPAKFGDSTKRKRHVKTLHKDMLD